MVNIKEIHKTFGQLHVLKGVSFDLNKAGIFTILGPNGSGKTTLIKSILGMVVPDSGDIFIDNYRVNGSPEYRENLDYLPQIARFPDNLTVKELISFIKTLRKKSTREDELISLFGLEAFLDKKLGTLSGGTRQKVNLVLTFMFDSPLVILDEPTSGLDPVSVVKLKGLLVDEKARGKTIIITTHILDFVEQHADRILFLLEGRMYFDGTVAEIKAQTGESSLEPAIAHLLENYHV